METTDKTLIKYDILSIDALDKIHITLDLLVKDGQIEQKPTLRETYENTIGIYNLIRDDQAMWQKCCQHKVLFLFQMEKESGYNGIETLQPSSVDELAILNSTIRLMPQEKGGEMPTDKLARFKQDKNAWIQELKKYGLGEKEKTLLEPIVGLSYGLCITQEQFMQLVQLPELGGFPLEFADRLRKSIAKKNPKDYEKITEEFFTETSKKGCNMALCRYVWNVLIAMSKGYGFNASHTLAYSLVGLQELNLAYKYPIIYWNTACLISNTGGAEDENEEETDEVVESLELQENYSNDFDDFNFDEDESEDENDEETTETKTSNKKKKVKPTEYGKVATAIGKMKAGGVSIAPPDINKADFTYTPDVEHNQIVCGLKGISRINKQIVASIIENRPYSSLTDFISKVKVNKTQLSNLIKSGAFDELGESREALALEHATMVAKPKTTLNMRNAQMLIREELLPREELDFEIRLFNFNRYLKNHKAAASYVLDNIAEPFYSEHFDVDLLDYSDGECKIIQKDWDKIYKKRIEPMKNYIKTHLDELLAKLNKKLIDTEYNSMYGGNISKWEMDSISYYDHEHELANVDLSDFGVTEFFDLPQEPIVDRSFISKEGNQVNLFKIERIAGTVLDKNKDKNQITLLTLKGVVTVKIFGNVFSIYDRRISQKDIVTGKKTVIEKSWFTRGNKVIVTGIRRGDSFIAKKYKNTPYHLVELIESIDEYNIPTIKTERAEVN